ncbi:MAG: T9SS type A sorting domain-containing protein [Ignavibacteriae bacterium]|jgi:hypothetical protein|nr:T9SS C-terminal target domain-containing protein [Ignavibacteriota bacterium]NOG98633.1 T9SS type A sorting domain-containing protein [Ignavibacteriota bacterium]
MNRIILLLLFSSSLILSQDDPLDYFPHHVGDLWQYRSQFTGELVGTRYIDSILTDPISKDVFIYYGHFDNGGTNDRYRIDSVGNLYNMNFNPDGIRYKLYAEIGDSWILRDADSVNLDTVIVSVVDVYDATVFGVNTTVKAFQFELHFPDQPIFWLGIDYLAKGFGLIRSEIEPSDIYVLTGAIIDSVEYGIITSVKDRIGQPQNFEVIKNYPNPFNNNTIISFSVSNYSNVNITVYDVLGSVVKELINESKPMGNYNLHFNADDLSSGPYFVVLTTDSKLYTHKMLLIK